MLTKDEISDLKSLQDEVIASKLKYEYARMDSAKADRALTEWLLHHTEGMKK